jgi:hypothetical protein
MDSKRLFNQSVEVSGAIRSLDFRDEDLDAENMTVMQFGDETHDDLLR